MNIPEFARRREVQILFVFGAVTIGGYYFWLKNKKDQLRWANAYGNPNIVGVPAGTNKTNKLLTEPKQVTACKAACAGSSDPVSCMGNCLNQSV